MKQTVCFYCWWFAEPDALFDCGVDAIIAESERIPTIGGGIITICGCHLEHLRPSDFAVLRDHLTTSLPLSTTRMGRLPFGYHILIVKGVDTRRVLCPNVDVAVIETHVTGAVRRR